MGTGRRGGIVQACTRNGVNPTGERSDWQAGTGGVQHSRNRQGKPDRREGLRWRVRMRNGGDCGACGGVGMAWALVG